MRQGITTKYLGPTNYRGSRIKATARKASSLGKEMSHTRSYQHGSSDEEHTLAAKELAAKLGWKGLWIGGGGKPEEDGNQYVNVARAHMHGPLPDPQRAAYADQFGTEDTDWFYIP